MNIPMPISPGYRKAIFEAVGLQAVLGFLCAMILDGGMMLLVWGIALIPFWAIVIAMMLRDSRTPSRTRIELVRFGFFPVLMCVFFLLHLLALVGVVR